MTTTFKKFQVVVVVLSLFFINLSFAQVMEKPKEGDKKHQMEMMNKDSVKSDNSKMMMMDDKMMKDESDIKVINLIQHPGTFNKTELILAPGKYKFNITNADVNKEVGFYIHEVGTKQPVPNSMPNATIKKGETISTGIVELKSGTYEYSCPLNPTPEYKIIVK